MTRRESRSTEKRIRQKIDKTPDVPGVYIMKDREGVVIYVGKAVSLRKRIMSHMRCSGNNTKNLLLSAGIDDFEFIPVASEAEALVLENRLIKDYQPRYNVNLKDGKSYPFVKITGERFPSLQIVREEKDGRSMYFGPFTNAGFIRSLVKFVRRYYPIRSCRRDIGGRRSSRLCTQYHIGRCAGPCAGMVSEAEYRRIADGAIAFFCGEYEDFKKRLKVWLAEEVRQLEFEKAEETKRRLFMIEEMERRFPLRDEAALIDYSRKDELSNLKDLLGMDKVPCHIEGFDVSNISGRYAVASRVSFRGGAPDRASYRRYRIKYDKGIDDYRMMEEVLRRRFSHKPAEPVPDLVLIDGGKGHLGVAAGVLEELGVKANLAALAKEKEELFLPGRDRPLRGDSGEKGLLLLQRVRDEAHRFALTYHRKLHRKGEILSLLDGIKGIGPARKSRIIQRFRGLEEIREAGMEGLKEAGIPAAVALEVLEKAERAVLRPGLQRRQSLRRLK